MLDIRTLHRVKMATVAAALLAGMPIVNAANSATLVGDLQHFIGTCGDWSPACADAFLTPPTEDTFFRKTVKIPEVTMSTRSLLMDLGMKTMERMTALGCKTNDNPACLTGQLADFAGTGTLSYIARSIPAGTYTIGLQQTSSLSTDKVSVPPFSITVPATGTVGFYLRSGTLTVTVENGETYTQAAKPMPTSTENPDAPSPTGEPLPNGCQKFGRQHFIKDAVKVGNYQYRGNVFYGEIKLKNLGFTKTVDVNWQDKNGTWAATNTCKAVYGSGPYQSNFEVWKFTCTVPASASGTEYYDSNGGGNYPVTPLAPFKSTKGFQRDISHFFQRNQPRAAKYMLANISPALTSRGVVVAAPLKQSRNQNYFYHWIRDASLTMDVVNELYKRGDKAREKDLWEHAAFTRKIQQTPAKTGLGEPKFYVNGTEYNDPWCRPQNDGPAFRASLFIRFADAYLKNGGDATRIRDLYNSPTTGVIKPDLDYVATSYKDFTTCDLWEEQGGAHFFTTMAIRRSMKEGAVFALSLNDTASAATYEAAGKELDEIVKGHWDEAFGTIRTTMNGRQLDAAIPLGVMHGYNGDEVFAPNDDKVLASLYTFALGMHVEYNLNLNPPFFDNHDGLMGTAIGRYYGDHYDGELTNGLGNPWYLTTAAFAEIYYRAATLYIQQGIIPITPLNFPFFSGPVQWLHDVYKAPSKEFSAVVDAVVAVADSYMRRVRFYAAEDVRLPEEFGRDCGDAYGVDDLTWSYASLLTASFAREDVWALWKKA
ncbi:Six-hairpin glycosidase-like protein [Chytridium lagenaria]|nr:Six-hairpin glycosidase-like protein [Chytridium lagenaria]